ncbi:MULTISPECIES: DUF6314 family protein [unclassified Herbaspirillum]|uniref:DUF6314 family protein n=1 Tax=unclassified Herbaspirillum TaxID=2624150 RepID=UPI00383B74C8
MNFLSPDLHAYFSGRWNFSRTMLGAEDVLIGEADGTAEFLRVSDTPLLHYKESGQLRLTADRRVVAFSRRFDYEIAGDLVHVAFADGMQAGQAYQSYRYDAVKQALLPVEAHLCILDRYDGSYQLIDTDQFELRTRIDGPQKDYLVHTHFTRAPG